MNNISKYEAILLIQVAGGHRWFTKPSKSERGKKLHKDLKSVIDKLEKIYESALS
jgi:hypothetical protein